MIVRMAIEGGGEIAVAPSCAAKLFGRNRSACAVFAGRTLGLQCPTGFKQ